MSIVFSPELTDRIATSGIIAVIVLEHASQAPHLADALQAGGISAVELALRTPASLGALQTLRHHAPQLLIGAGTVIRPEQVRQVQDAGADFAVAPGANRRILQAAAEAGLPFAPGVAVPSDIEATLEFDCNALKFFPAEPSGGLPYLRSMIAPYQHCGLRMIPLGGLNAANIAPYAADKNILAIGGSWIAPKELISAQDWQAITARAQEAMTVIRQNRS